MDYTDRKALIAMAGSRIFSACFTKKDGSERIGAFRLHVSRPKNAQAPQGLTDRVSEDERHNVLTVYDFNADRRSNALKGGYRRINLDTLKWVQIDGHKITF